MRRCTTPRSAANRTPKTPNAIRTCACTAIRPQLTNTMRTCARGQMRTLWGFCAGAQPKVRTCAHDRMRAQRQDNSISSASRSSSTARRSRTLPSSASSCRALTAAPGTSSTVATHRKPSRVTVTVKTGTRSIFVERGKQRRERKDLFARGPGGGGLVVGASAHKLIASRAARRCPEQPERADARVPRQARSRRVGKKISQRPVTTGATRQPIVTAASLVPSLRVDCCL
jgi:hypothetical protein